MGGCQAKTPIKIFFEFIVIVLGIHLNNPQN